VEKRQNNVSVTIKLIDVNDNSPVFLPVTGYMVNIAENSGNGVSVLNVRNLFVLCIGCDFVLTLAPYQQSKFSD
jgi:hypothetical protein